MATYQSIRYNVDYGGKAGILMPLLTFTSDGSDATADFTSKIDSTYEEYLFIINNLHGETNDTNLQWQVNAVGGSGFNETVTSQFFYAWHDEADSATEFTTATYGDQAQGTDFIRINNGCTNNSDDNQGAWLRLYNPSSTTFVKHFLSCGSTSEETPAVMHSFAGGYINTTSALDEVQFRFSSGEIQGGTIQMFGVH